MREGQTEVFGKCIDQAECKLVLMKFAMKNVYDGNRKSTVRSLNIRLNGIFSITPAQVRARDERSSVIGHWNRKFSGNPQTEGQKDKYVRTMSCHVMALKWLQA